MKHLDAHDNPSISFRGFSWNLVWLLVVAITVYLHATTDLPTKSLHADMGTEVMTANDEDKGVGCFRDEAEKQTGI